jgi:hypothetical protein
VDDVRLNPPQVLFDLVVAYQVLKWINRPSEFIDNYDFIFLVLGLIKKLTFGAYSGPCNQRDFVPAFSQKPAGDERIFLRPAKYQPRYYVNNSQYSIRIKQSPAAGASGPAAVRSRASRISSTFSGFHLPLPTSTKVPTIFRTILYRKLSPSTSIYIQSSS